MLDYKQNINSKKSKYIISIIKKNKIPIIKKNSNFLGGHGPPLLPLSSATDLNINSRFLKDTNVRLQTKYK